MGGEKEEEVAQKSNKYAPESQIDWLDGGSKERKDLLDSFLGKTKSQNAEVLAELLSVPSEFECAEGGIQRARFVRDFWTETISSTDELTELFACSEPPKVSTSDGLLNQIASTIADRTTTTGRLQPAGYTYLGQFITHDIVSSTNLINDRVATPDLNLDSVYFDESKANFEKLVEWGAVTTEGLFEFTDDVDLKRETWTTEQLEGGNIPVPPRGKTYHIAIIPEHRNDGNIILSQLHVLWQKVHNHFVREVTKNLICPDGERAFSLAKILTTLIFQHVVIEDYLSRTIDPDVYQYYFVDNRELQLIDPCSDFAIPREFSHAVSRYGHTMVRQKYKLKKKDKKKVDLGTLLAKNSKACEVLGENSKPFQQGSLIDWDLFFKHHNPNHKDRNLANTISLRSVEGLHEVQGNVSQTRKIKLIRADLDASLQLATYGEALQCDALRQLLDRIKNIGKPERYLRRISFNKFKDITQRPIPNIDNSPFWLTQLLESEMAPGSDSGVSRRGNRDKLGAIASIVMAETIKASILKSDISIYKLDAKLRNQLGSSWIIYQNFVTENRTVKLLDLIPLTI